MSLTLHYHPLSSFCQKALVAFYENDVPFTPHLVDFGDPRSAAALKALWPVGKIPVLRDEARDRTIPEATIIIEYLAAHHPGRTPLVPADADRAWQVRLRDRFDDLYVNVPMQKVVTDRLRPADARDAHGVAEATRLLETAYDVVDREMAGRTWAVGDAFTMADCAAAPALWYANWAVPIGDRRPHAAAYLLRLTERPSFARAFAEAAPYRANLPTG